MLNVMTADKLVNVRKKVQTVVSYGQSVTFIKPATKDEFGELLTIESMSLNVFPVRYAPFDRKIANNVSWSDNVDVICFIAKQDLIDSSLGIDDIKTYSMLRIDGKRFEIKRVENYMAFADDFLYVIVGAGK